MGPKILVVVVLTPLYCPKTVYKYNLTLTLLILALIKGGEAKTRPTKSLKKLDSTFLQNNQKTQEFEAFLLKSKRF